MNNLFSAEIQHIGSALEYQSQAKEKDKFLFLKK